MKASGTAKGVLKANRMNIKWAEKQRMKHITDGLYKMQGERLVAEQQECSECGKTGPKHAMIECGTRKNLVFCDEYCMDQWEQFTRWER
jgi:ferredoxin-like protein FixX